MSEDTKYVSDQQQRLMKVLRTLAGNEIEGLAPLDPRPVEHIVELTTEPIESKDNAPSSRLGATGCRSVPGSATTMRCSWTP